MHCKEIVSIEMVPCHLIIASLKHAMKTADRLQRNIVCLPLNRLLYEAMQDENAKLCFTFRSGHSVLNFSPENIVPEVLLRIRCNKPVKVPLTLVHYRKYCAQAWSRIKYSTRFRLVLY